MSGEFEKKIKKMNLDPKYEQELLAMFNQASDENPCSACRIKDDCEKNKNHKKSLNTSNEEKDDKCSSCSSCGP